MSGNKLPHKRAMRHFDPYDLLRTSRLNIFHRVVASITSMLLCIFVMVTTAIALSQSPHSAILQLPSTNQTITHLHPTNISLLTLEDEPWPRVPFDLHTIGTTTQFIHCSPVDIDEGNVEYRNEAIAAVDELVEKDFINENLIRPMPRFTHMYKEPVTLDVRMTGRRPVTREKIGFALSRIAGLFFIHGPATLAARLLGIDGELVGTLRIFVPFPPESDEEV